MLGCTTAEFPSPAIPPVAQKWGIMGKLGFFCWNRASMVSISTCTVPSMEFSEEKVCNKRKVIPKEMLFWAIFWSQIPTCPLKANHTEKDIQSFVQPTYPLVAQQKKKLSSKEVSSSSTVAFSLSIDAKKRKMKEETFERMKTQTTAPSITKSDWVEQMLS